jgi:uncharacterized membrane protein YdjX (TVP38/TMEM64 family)
MSECINAHRKISSKASLSAYRGAIPVLYNEILQKMPNPPKAASTSARFVRLIPIAFIAFAAVTGLFLFGDNLSFATLKDNREVLLGFRDKNYLLTVVAFISVYIVIVAFSLPGASVATLTGGFLFATFPGVMFNVTAATLGAMAIFLAARWGLGDFLASRMDQASGPMKKLKAGIDSNQWATLFLMRLVPAIPFFVANLAPAFLGVPLFRFAVSTFLGIIPGTLVFTAVGAGLGDVFEHGTNPNLAVIFEPQILLPILGLCVLAALPILLNVFRK